MHRNYRNHHQQCFGLLWNLAMKKILVALLVLSAFASEPQRTVTAEQRARFWRAQAEYVAKLMEVQRLKAAMDAAEDDMVKTCGGALVPDKAGEPSCNLTKKE